MPLTGGGTRTAAFLVGIPVAVGLGGVESVVTFEASIAHTFMGETIQQDGGNDAAGGGLEASATASDAI
jgi:hypothetical protein